MESSNEMNISGKAIDNNNPGNPPPVPKSMQFKTSSVIQNDLKTVAMLSESNTCFLYNTVEVCLDIILLYVLLKKTCSDIKYNLLLLSEIFELRQNFSDTNFISVFIMAQHGT